MEEIKQALPENTQTPQKEAIAPAVEEVKTEPETEQQINWKKFREVREKERKEKVEAERKASDKEVEVQALKAAMEALVNKPQSNTQQIETFSEESEDQRIDRLVGQAIEKEKQKNQIENQEKERREFPVRLAREFPDFDKVCNSENLDYFEYHYPEVADAYKHMPDGFDKWSKVYKAVKRFVPNTVSKNSNAAMAEKNLSKPQSMSIGGKTQTGDMAPQYLDDKRKADNWSRMQKAMKSGLK
jgi:hypothetical protein